MSLPAVISELIERFERNREAYRSGQYNETQVRLEFINPFFKALGWDIDNEQGYADEQVGRLSFVAPGLFGVMKIFHA